MYGAILGDIIGSRFEFDRCGKTKEFELFTSEDDYTDDTVAEGFLRAGIKAAGLDYLPEEMLKVIERCEAAKVG